MAKGASKPSWNGLVALVVASTHPAVQDISLLCYTQKRSITIRGAILFFLYPLQSDIILLPENKKRPASLRKRTLK